MCVYPVQGEMATSLKICKQEFNVNEIAILQSIKEGW